MLKVYQYILKYKTECETFFIFYYLIAVTSFCFLSSLWHMIRLFLCPLGYLLRTPSTHRKLYGLLFQDEMASYFHMYSDWFDSFAACKLKAKVLAFNTYLKLESKGSVGSSSEDLDCTSTEKKTRIRDKLKFFFLRRPTMESLQEQGIIKDEPVFGCTTLTALCSKENTQIPKFVQNCIDAIENKGWSIIWLCPRF